MSSTSSPWQIWIDTGGTFTDCIALTPTGKIQRLKILSNSVLRGRIIKRIDDHTLKAVIPCPAERDIFKNFEFRLVDKSFSSKILRIDLKENTIHLTGSLPKKIGQASFEITSNEEVPVLAARLLTTTALDQSFPALEMKLGSTRGTNAILERKGARTALFVTKGFKDLLLIGNQQRPDLFTCNIIKPKPLYDEVVEIDERIESDGTVLKPLDPSMLQSILPGLKKRKIESVAIALLNSYKNPTHELQIEKTLKAAGFNYSSASSNLSSQIKILSRAETSVANAYLDPIIHTYVSGIQRGLAGSRLSIMTSAGSLCNQIHFIQKTALLSGPAGGVVGAAHQALRSNVRKIIAFDMGGTSTDVSLYNDRFDYRFESHVGNFKILSPSLAIETIAAGGGSICDFDGYRFTVGPHSAGASPGPACYGAGGPLTITDVNLLLGRLDPQIFTIPIDIKKSQDALDSLLEKVKRLTGHNSKSMPVLEALTRIANEKMAEAIKKISVQQGHDPHEFTLLSFGGAGGQHACALASILEIKKVLVPYDAGLLSAYGIGHATIEKFEEKLVLNTWRNLLPDFHSLLQSLFDSAKLKLLKKGFQENEVVWKKSLIFLRFSGQDSALEIDFKIGDDILKSFRKKYISIFGHWVDREVEVESLKVIASVRPTPGRRSARKTRAYKPVADKKQWIYSEGNKRKAMFTDGRTCHPVQP
ncbi:MAG: hydantoinase/oxoprolinase family protein [Bacteroidota bacterium]